MLATLRALFPRPVRAALYAAGAAGDTALVAAHQLPAWTLPVLLPLLLALLHLSPSDVDQKRGEGGLMTVADVCLVVIAGVLLLSWLGFHGHH